jgi:hypothetical protein
LSEGILSRQRFLVQAVEDDFNEIPHGTQIIEADSIETLANAQRVKQAVVDFFSHRRASVGDLRRAIQSLITIL